MREGPLFFLFLSWELYFARLFVNYTKCLVVFQRTFPMVYHI